MSKWVTYWFSLKQRKAKATWFMRDPFVGKGKRIKICEKKKK